MKKHLFLLTLLSISLMMWAEAIPTDYYKACNGKKDAALKTALSETVKGGERYRYGSNEYHTSTQIAKKDTVVWGVLYHKGDTICRPGDLEAYGTWQAFPVTDRRPDGSIWDMYSNTRRSFTNKRGESASNVEIEHCFPKSWWGTIQNAAWCDLYHLNPSDKQANGNKSNFPPGEVQKGDKFDNGVFRMDKATSSKYGWCCFEPADCYKGDFARAYFYIATAYEDLVWADVAKEYLDNNSYLEFKPWLIEVLLKWHRLDPVSQKELDRADQISSIQHNRNPYIDYPELVEYIWGEKQGAAVDFSKLQCTQDPSYIPQKENNLFEAYPAQDVCSDYFVASWNNFYKGPYILEVYTQRQMTGSNDTIIKFPALTKNILNDDPHGYASEKMQSQGKSSILMGSGATDAWLELHDLTLNKPSQLVFRASQYATATAAQLDIFLNDHITADTSIIDLTRDEVTYCYTLPATTTKVKIMSVGGSTSKRACMQELYIIQGDYREQLTYIEGYPQQIAETKANVLLPSNMEGEVYYRVRCAAGWYTNEISLSGKPIEETFSLNIVVAPGAPGTTTGSGIYPAGQKVTISAIADKGYHFTQWSDGNKENPREIIVTQDLLLEAYFAQNISPTTATIIVNFDKGYVQIDDSKIESGKTYEYPIGTELTLKAGVEKGHSFDKWSDGVKGTQRTLVLDKDTVLATIYKINQYEIKTAVEGGKGGVVIGSGKYDYGTEVELTAVPDDGYLFVEWKEDHNTDNPRIVTVTNKSTQLYTAVFEVASALDNVTGIAMPKKMYINGRLYVVRGGQIFSVLGQKVHE